MASTNFLTVKSHLTDFKDTISEASESGTSNSVTSAEDLQKLAVILGLNSAEDVYQERFRVDRRRLEAMLVDNLEESQTAQAFFHRVMNETNTLINWPVRLKIGARSKKDPNVKVTGRRPEDVKLARDKIMQLLDTRGNRVTMKIDVSYTDHSHIIGKGGLTIKRVMEETGCHIHFPDSNRTSAVEKSNQVSIAGDMDRVERARARVRALTPLIFCFELPIVSSPQSIPDPSSPYITQVQEQYNVQVMIRSRAKLHANLVIVKGQQWEVEATMEATTLLMNYMCGTLASQTKVQMTMEISPMHHPVVVGRGAEQLKLIMKGTKTQILIPDAEDPNIPVLRKSCVTITGQIADVYAARQQLIGCLPLVLIFDVMEEMMRVDTEDASRLMHKHNVYITIRRKPKHGIANIVIKGIERCAGDIYEARRELLGEREPSVLAEIPDTYTIPAATGNTMPNFGVYNPYSPSHPGMNIPNSQCSPYLPLEMTNFVGLGSPMYGQPGGYPSPISPVSLAPQMFPNAWMIPSPQHRTTPFQYPTLNVPNPNPVMYKNQGGSWNPISAGTEMAPPMQQPVMMQPPYQPQDSGPSSSHHMLNSSSVPSSGYQSNFTGSTVSLDTPNLSGGEASNMVSPAVSPISKTHSPAASADIDRSNELATILSDLQLPDRRAVGCEKKTREVLNKLSPLSEYRKLKADADKAMHESVSGAPRIPTPRWAGHYFSNTSPGNINLNRPGDQVTPEKLWNKSDLVRPVIAEPTPSPKTPSKCRTDDLYNLFQVRGLNKYIDLFKKHELDLATFKSLNDADLIEIGVTAFGARRKMLLIITELKNRVADTKPSPSNFNQFY